ncbi:MAG: hypothetical protein Q8Q07_03775, partial [Dehalococcoidales bacterium]|nr:hypothetical protein [Dehalococcoidales bacterium]
SDIMPTFSPDGTEISFVSNRDGNYEIYVMNADGTGQTRLTDNDVSDTYPSWLLDGTQISFSSMRDGNSEIYTMDANGSNPVRLTDNDITDEQPFWCPTGNAIVFTSWVDSTPQVVFIGMRDYVGYQAQFTDNPEGNWSRANWTIPDTQIFTITASAGANGSIAPSGAVTVSSSDNQSFIITPDTGYHVANVLVDGTPVGAVTSYHFTNVTANHTISATFADDTTEPYTITASAGANGSIMPSGVVEVNPGDSQTFAIAAVIGYHVADVLVDGVSVGAVGSYDFDNVMANHTIVVSFASNDSLTEILKSIIEGTDDGYSTSSSGDFSDNVTWYEAGSPTENATHNAWFRFTDITIPANAIIDEAFLETIHSNWYTGTSLKIFAEAADNPSAPTSADDHSSRVRTATGVAWTNGYSDITWHTSPNFASVIQELVSSYSYNNGVIQILVDNDGSTAGAGAAGSTFEHTGFAPRLYIRYRVEPSVTTNAATSVTASTAIMNGNLTSLGNASSANVYFEYGTSTSYGDTVAGAPSSLTNIGAFTANLAGLTAGTTYFYRAKVVGTGTAYGAQATFTTPSTPPSGGGGGGGGSSSLTSLNLSGMSGSAPVLNAQGEVISSSVLTSTDGQAKILIPAGTKMLRNGSALSAITCAQTASPPEPPADNIIVAGYNFGPDGATFNPPITLTLHFNIADLPAGTLLSELQLAFWDGTTWQILSNSQVDAATGQISAQVSHFTHFAILSAVPPVTPAPVPTVTPTVTPTTEPAPTQPTKTLTPSEPSAVVPPAEASISETPQPITGKSPAPSINLWVILGVIAIIIIGILTIASARQIKRRRSL